MLRKFLLATAVAISLAAPAYAKGEAEEAGSDRQFITDALRGNNSEVALGQMAIEKGSSTGVKTYGQTLATDHGKSKSEVMTLASKMGIAPTDEITPEAETERSKLQELSGTDFDREFLTFMIEDHKKEIAKFERQAQAGTGEVADLARKTLPTLQKHLDQARSLNQASQ